MSLKRGLVVVVVVATLSLTIVHSREYVTLDGTKASDPPMLCDENDFKHYKPDGQPLDVETFSDPDNADSPIKISEEGSRYSLVIKLDEGAPFQYFLGTWTCGDNQWLVKGKPYIRRLGLEGDIEKHRNSYTVNEGNAVQFECEAYVIFKEGPPEFKWQIEDEDVAETLTAPRDFNVSKWRATTGQPMEDNHAWKSTFELIDTSEGITKEDRHRYVCTVSVFDPDLNEKVESRRSMLLRVKGKFAALWPAIGIVIEVLLLGIGTCIYERKRKAAKSEPAGEPASNDADAARGRVVQT